MAKCKQCAKKGLFLKINTLGICQNCEELNFFENAKCSLQKKITDLKTELSDEEKLYNSIADQAKCDATEDIDRLLSERKGMLENLERKISIKEQELEALQLKEEKTQKSLNLALPKVQRAQLLYKAAIYALDKCSLDEEINAHLALNDEIHNFLSDTIELKLQCMSVKELRTLFNQNRKGINDVLEKYKGRYTNKTNFTIYKLIVIGLEAELENTLYKIKFGKIDDSIQSIKSTIEKYRTISTDGNQTIASTISRFLAEIEYMYIEAIKIEYEYYIQRERIKEEQRAIREQMKQEAEERRHLEQERKKVEKEEEKYKSEMEEMRAQLSETVDPDRVLILQNRIVEIQTQLNSVEEKKEEITKLQHGKAGYVYVVSNLGSFGEEVFKIGMTRRIEPQDRINELGNASVPFPFDVHGLIFSDDAVGLESNLHKMLHHKRVNKINLRKEFFKASIAELEDLVYSLQPSAEFNRTLIAEQYNQSLSIDEVPENILESIDDENETEIALEP